MPVVAVFEGLEQERYEDVVARLTGEKGRLDSPADWPVQGLLVRVAGPAEHGFCVVDVRESEEVFLLFAELLGPVLEEIGLESRPEVYPAHTLVVA